MRPVVEIEELRLPPTMFVSDITDADLDAQASRLPLACYDAASRVCRLSQHAWLIEANGKTVVVDPCVGHQRERALPFYNMIDSPFLERLEALGVRPEDVDYVFCTHLHLDHVGWNTRLEDGRFVPTFKNARYLFSRIENDFWKRDLDHDLPVDERYNLGIYGECIKPVIDAGLADIVKPGARIADCLTLIDATGHTVGHLAGMLESDGQGAVLAGDAIHHPIQVLFPDREIHAYDPENARATRHRLLSLCADRDYWLAPAHFRPPHLCKIVRDGANYEMVWPETISDA
jgi:glyoxylase-like metal-dependent hydrolase (beta-lactamase superfamily II)